MMFSDLLPDLKTCEPDRSELFSDEFNRVVGGMNVHNIFNPAFYVDDEVKIFAFRAIVDGQSELAAFLSIEDAAGHSVGQLRVDAYSDIKAPRFIDPKLFKLDDGIYMTFNSGWSPEGNQIFIMKIYPEMDSPRELVYANRKKYERNWAFFSEQGKIFALYWINPLKILELTHTGADFWRLEDYYSAAQRQGDVPDDLTIGTQLAKIGDEYHFVAHQKRSHRGKKLYLGRYCKLDFRGREMAAGKYWLVHSLKSILGSRIKHNSNLFSCTYFSGIQAVGGSVVLGYGVNDVDYGFSQHKPDEL